MIMVWMGLRPYISIISSALSLIDVEWIEAITYSTALVTEDTTSVVGIKPPYVTVMTMIF